MGDISESTRAFMKKQRIIVSSRKKKKYVKVLMVDTDYNFLEYYAIVRRFMQWKYEISNDNLELLFYLYPRTYFSKADFKKFPVKWGNHRFEDMVQNQFIENVFPDRVQKTVYRLTTKSKLMVQMTHKLLSGEKQIPTDARYNPAFKEKANYIQKKYQYLMEDMRELIGQKLENE